MTTPKFLRDRRNNRVWPFHEALAKHRDMEPFTPPEGWTMETPVRLQPGQVPGKTMATAQEQLDEQTQKKLVKEPAKEPVTIEAKMEVVIGDTKTVEDFVSVADAIEAMETSIKSDIRKQEDLVTERPQGKLGLRTAAMAKASGVKLGA